MMTPSQNVTQLPSQTILDAKDRQTFLEHLHEFRNRLFIMALVLVGGTLIGYSWHDQLIQFLITPLGGQKLIYLTPGGGFDFIFKVSLYVGCALAIPVGIYQLYRYLRPVMGIRGQRLTPLVLILSNVLAIAGMTFGYFVALPAALRFLTGFGGEYIEAALTASSYLNFVVAYMLGLALLFQLPLILLFLNATNGPLKPRQLFISEKYVVLGVFILAAIITPTPDIANQTIVAAPVLGVYQLGIGLVLWQNRGRSQRRTAYESKDQTAVIEPIKPISWQNSQLRVAAVEPAITATPISPHQTTVVKPSRPIVRSNMDIVASRHTISRREVMVPARQQPAQTRPLKRRQTIDGVLQPGYY